jgi:N-acyl amino acid synthase of PEP-CTERM/exosortase system
MTTVNLSLFDDHFAVVDAQKEGLVNAIFSLRYEVWCVENKWLPQDIFPDRQERDQFDSRALYTALVHKKTNEVFGCVRLVLPDHAAGINSLPIFSICRSEAQQFFGHLPVPGTAEVSRFAISRSAKQRIVADFSEDTNDIQKAEQTLLRHATLGLIRGILGHCADHGVQHLCALMEPALQRLMMRSGVNIRPSASKIMHFGVRRPCYMRVADQSGSIRQADLHKHQMIFTGSAAKAA